LERKLEALSNKPDKGASGRKKVDILNDLAYALCTSDPPKAESYANQALVLAEKLNYKKAVVTSCLNLGFSYYTRRNYNKATEYCRESLRMSEEIRDRKGIAASHNGIGLTYRRQGDYAHALQHFFKAMKIWKEITDKKSMALVYGNIGNVYQRLSDYVQTLEYHFKALQVFEEIGDDRGIAMSRGNIGIVYDLQSDYEHALEYYFKALKTQEKLGDKIAASNSYNNIGLTYEKQGVYDKALEYHLTGLNIKEEIGDKDGIAISYNNIGDIYEKQGDHEQALEYNLKALKIQKEIGDKNGTARSYNRIGRVQTKLKYYDSALKYLHKALQLAHDIGAKDEEIENYKNLSALFEAQAEYGEALNYHKKYTDIEKEVYNVEKSKQIAEINTKYEIDKREKEAEVYHLKNVKLRKEIKERKKVEEELKKHHDQLEKLVEERTIELRKELAKRQIAEKELLKHQNQLVALNHALSLVEEKQRRKTATYLHDNIGQALSLAIFKIRSLQESDPAKNVKKELAEIKDIVAQTNQRTRSLTFEISPPVLYELGLEPAIEWLVGQFQRQHGITCSFKDDGASKHLTDEARILLFQAVRELLINVSKHAHAQTVRVSTARDGNVICISVEDDGIGFNPESLGKKIARNEGFGLFNIKERLRHLGGELKVSASKGQGTSIMLIAPIKRKPRKTNGKRR
jgi:signal transduction histidine kinase